MQSTINLSTVTPIGLSVTKLPSRSVSLRTTAIVPGRLRLLRTAAAASNDPATVDYNSAASVFPAEACETIGGEACEVEMYPETKLESSPAPKSVSAEAVDREYLQYDGAKTVFPGEACDELGGEFCDPEYQKGVY